MKTLVTAVSVAILIFALSAHPAAANEFREWKASNPASDCEGTVGWLDPEFDDSSWSTLSLPDEGAWECDECDRFYRGYLNVTDLDHIVTLGFGSDDGLWLYVNGFSIGHWGGDCHQEGCVNNPYGRCLTSESVDPIVINDYLDIGTNVVAVHVSDYLMDEYLSVEATFECPDLDGDGYADEACGGDDCDDSDAAVNPEAEEICDNTLDDDCDGLVDGDDPDCVTVFTLELDASYDAGTLSLVYTLGTPEAATWVNYLVLTSPGVQVIPLWSVPLPVIDPPVSFPVAFPFPSLGIVGFWAGLFTEEGAELVVLEWIDTGLPTQ